MLTPRWYPLRFHPIQSELWKSTKRFEVVPAGRRSGKTELGKRKGVKFTLGNTTLPDYWAVFAAPTRDQAKRLFWNDLKKMFPPVFVESIRESELTIRLITGAEASVVGMDKPERIEGRPLDFILLDEYANMHAAAWSQNVRPALSTVDRPPGRAMFTGVPEGRNHYYKLALYAQDPVNKEWGHFHWKSEDILDPKEIAQAKQDLDPLTYAQEYEASFLNFEGRAYYPFERALHSRPIRAKYSPKNPISFCFDFNVAPGVAAIVQEINDEKLGDISGCLGEVWIAQNSNTAAICNRLLQDWGKHAGDVLLYGDATGGAKGTAQVQGSDWDIIRQVLRPVFGDRLKLRVKSQNPKERVRINAVNARLKTADGKIHFLVDPSCIHVIEDFEGVTLLEGGSGEIDKFADEERTHITDAIGYYLEYKFPLVVQTLSVESLF